MHIWAFAHLVLLLIGTNDAILNFEFSAACLGGLFLPAFMSVGPLYRCTSSQVCLDKQYIHFPSKSLLSIINGDLFEYLSSCFTILGENQLVFAAFLLSHGKEKGKSS